MNNKPPKILYHYCSNETFCSIVQNKTIWLSSLLLSNDTQEGLWIDQIIDNLVQDFDSPEEFREAISKFFNPSKADGLGFCMSKEGDMLSQWRGYANDGMGVSIGFSTKYFDKIGQAQDTESGFSFREVNYNEREQTKMVRPLLNSIDKFARSIPSFASEEATDKLTSQIRTFWDLKFRIKNPAFSEENEWRLISPYIPDDQQEPDPDPVMLRAVNNRLIPYREYPIMEGQIKKVILGPKNISKAVDLRNYLELQGFSNVDISSSSASYR